MVTIEVTMPDGTKQTFSLSEKQFKTGSRGFHAQGKIPFDGKRYQANLMLIEIGSKPAA